MSMVDRRRAARLAVVSNRLSGQPAALGPHSAPVAAQGRGRQDRTGEAGRSSSLSPETRRRRRRSPGSHNEAGRPQARHGPPPRRALCTSRAGTTMSRPERGSGRMSSRVKRRPDRAEGRRAAPINQDDPPGVLRCAGSRSGRPWRRGLVGVAGRPSSAPSQTMSRPPRLAILRTRFGRGCSSAAGLFVVASGQRPAARAQINSDRAGRRP
jgi:hypothetical protein